MAAAQYLAIALHKGDGEGVRQARAVLDHRAPPLGVGGNDDKPPSPNVQTDEQPTKQTDTAGTAKRPAKPKPRNP